MVCTDFMKFIFMVKIFSEDEHSITIILSCEVQVIESTLHSFIAQHNPKMENMKIVRDIFMTEFQTLIIKNSDFDSNL